jgi:hypothetical protein
MLTVFLAVSWDLMDLMDLMDLIASCSFAGVLWRGNCDMPASGWICDLAEVAKRPEAIHK